MDEMLFCRGTRTNVSANILVNIGVLAIVLSCGSAEDPTKEFSRSLPYQHASTHAIRRMRQLDRAIYTAYDDGILPEEAEVSGMSDLLDLLPRDYIGSDPSNYNVDGKEIDAFALSNGMGIILAYPYGMAESEYSEVLAEIAACDRIECVTSVIEEVCVPGFKYSPREGLSTGDIDVPWWGKIIIVWCRPPSLPDRLTEDE